MRDPVRQISDERPAKDAEPAIGKSLLAVGLTAALAACNGVDPTIGTAAPIPPLEIASIPPIGGPFANDGGAMPSFSEAAPVPRTPSGAVERTSLPAPALPGGSDTGWTAAPGSQPVASSMNDGSGWEEGRSGPAIDDSPPLPPPPEPGMQTAARALPDPSAPEGWSRSGTDAASVSEPPADPVQVAERQPGQPIGEVQFLPLTGAPDDKAGQLARALSETAKNHGIVIRPAAEAATDVRLKGYLSTFDDGTRTTLVYVWDVVGKDDSRIRRIQGQESVEGTAADPWSLISADVFSRVAARTFGETAEVLSTRG